MERCRALDAKSGSFVRSAPPPPVMINLLPLKLKMPTEPKTAMGITSPATKSWQHLRPLGVPSCQPPCGSDQLRLDDQKYAWDYRRNATPCFFEDATFATLSYRLGRAERAAELNLMTLAQHRQSVALLEVETALAVATKLKGVINTSSSPYQLSEEPDVALRCRCSQLPRSWLSDAAKQLLKSSTHLPAVLTQPVSMHSLTYDQASVPQSVHAKQWGGLNLAHHLLYGLEDNLRTCGRINVIQTV